MIANNAFLTYRRVVVTGAAGFVGQHLMRRLAISLVTDARLFRLQRQDEPARELPGEALVADLTDSSALEQALAIARPDLIVHLAAQSSVGTRGDSAETVRTNLDGTIRLAEAARRHAAGCTFLFVSSAEVYGAAFNAGVADETTPCLPLSPYARSKLAAEYALTDLLYDRARLLIVRPSNHSGQGQDRRFVLPSFACQIAAAEAAFGPREIRVGNLDAERDFMSVQDVVDAYCRLLSCSDPPHGLYTVASGRTVKIRELLDRLIARSRVSVSVTLDPARLRPSDVPRAALDPARIKGDIGWQADEDLTSMLDQVLACARIWTATTVAAS